MMVLGRRADRIGKGWADPRFAKQSVTRVQIYMSVPLVDRVREIAVRDGLPLSAVMRELVCDGLKARQVAA
jgi:cytidylate kinase